MTVPQTHIKRFRKNLKQFYDLKLAGKLNGKAEKIEQNLKEAAEIAGLDFKKETQKISGKGSSKRKPLHKVIEDYILEGLEYISPENDDRENPAVSPDEIYESITKMMIQTIKSVGHLPWQKTWTETGLYGGRVATNFVSKKSYRGINYFLLNFEQKKVGGEFIMVPRQFENPYFLTFNQVEELKGKVKKDSTGQMVIYFTKLYKFESAEDPDNQLEFSTYDRQKMINWLNKNRANISLFAQGFTVAQIANQSFIPILKYYRVFNGSDIEGIDFGKIPENENVDLPAAQKLQVGEAIYDHFPNRPPVQYNQPRAFYSPAGDFINMPLLKDFSEPQYYYSTLFHEMIHSTGHAGRVGRDLKGGKGSKNYAFEELIAEMGAVYLCAESGILFRTIDNSAKYLTSWNKRLVKQMEEDHRFFFRAASRAQGASDYILDRNKEGVPAYMASMSELIDQAAKPEKKPVRKVKSKPSDLPYLVADDSLIEATAEKINAVIFETPQQVKDQFFDLTHHRSRYQVDDKDLFKMVQVQEHIRFDTAAGLRNALEVIELSEIKRVMVGPGSELAKKIFKTTTPKIEELRREIFVYGNYNVPVFTNGHVMIMDKKLSKKLLDKEIEKERKRLIKEGYTPSDADSEIKKTISNMGPVKVEEVTPDKSRYVGQATLVGYTYQYLEGGDPTNYMKAICIAGGVESHFKDDLFSFMVKQLPDSRLELTGDNRAGVFVQDHEPVGLLMPMHNYHRFVPVDEEQEPVTARSNPDKPLQLELRANPTKKRRISKKCPDIRLVKPKFQFPTEADAWENVANATGFSPDQVEAIHTQKCWRWKKAVRENGLPKKARFIMLGVVEEITIEQLQRSEKESTKTFTLIGPHALLTNKAKDKIFVVPFHLLEKLPKGIRDVKANDVYKMWHNFDADNTDYKIQWPAEDKLLPVGTAVNIIYASDKVLREWDRKGKLNLYEHTFDPGKRPATKKGNILIISNLEITQAGILN